MANIGDTVRFLNDVGGGVIARIEGRIAYVVDPDGFETPMHLAECVVVPSAKEPAKPAAKTSAAKQAAKEPDAPAPARPKVAQPSAAEVAASVAAASNSVALLFEPQDIRRLSQSAFDLYLVNDTALHLYYVIATRDRLDSSWTLLAHGLCDPGVQEFIGDVFHTDLNRFENISVQLLSFNPAAPYALQPPVAMEIRFDTTRLAKLHCFTSTAYSAAPVLTLPIVTAGKLCHPTRLEALVDNAPVPPKDAPAPRRKAPTKPATVADPEVVDLHISELLDSTAGLEPAEMLALQLEDFDKKMAEAAKTPGRKIIFIHGKGEGVLRRAILDRLRRRWPRCEAQDASFREYGFGATQVTIHK